MFDGSRDSFTLSLWYKADGHNDSGENSELFSLYNSGAEKFLFYGAPQDSSQNAFTMKWDGTYGYANVIGGYRENEWVHLVFAVEAADGQSKITAYVNGAAVEVDQGGEWANSLMSGLGIDTFTIGGKNPYKGGPTPNCLFYGMVDEIRLYAGVLTADEAQTIYQETLGTGGGDPNDDPPARGDVLAYYSFDDETTDDSAGSRDAVLYNNAAAADGTYAEGISGKGLKLSAQGTEEKYWLSIPYSVFNGSRDSFTLSLWYKAEGYNTSGEDSELFSFYNSSQERFLFYSPAPTGFQDKGFTMKWDGSYGYANVMTPYAEGRWVHLVFAVEAANGQSRITAYVNGAAVEVDQGGEWANSLMSGLGIDTFTIGGKNPYKGGPTPNCLFYGMVDEIRLYAGALTASEARTIYKETLGIEDDPNPGIVIPGPGVGGFAPSDDGDPRERGDLLAYYAFDDSLQDSVGGKDVSLFNGGAAATPEFVDGISDRALKLSTQGTDERYWLNVPYSVFSGSRDSFTLSLWYKAEGYNTSGEDSELFSFYNSSQERFLFYSPAPTAFQDKGFTMKWDSSYGYANVITPYARNKWVHLVFAVEAVDGQSKITAYVNGAAVEVDQGGEWANSLMSRLGIDTFTIGGKNPYKGGPTPNCLFYGAVDEVRLYAGVLTASEARALYREARGIGDIEDAAPGPGSTVPNLIEDGDPRERGDLLAYYAFDDSLQDSAGGKDVSLFNGGTAATPVFVDGISDKALKLSAQGTDERYWLNVPYSVFSGSRDSFTLSLWYKAEGYNTSGEDSELFSFYNSAQERFLFYSPASTAFQDKGFTMKWDSSYGYANVITPYAENEWTHLAFAVEAVDGRSKITAYVNGKPVEVDQGGEWANSLMSQLGIDTFTIGGKNPYKGGPTPNCLFYGAVDEVRLYAGVLTADEVQTIYNEPLGTEDGGSDPGDNGPGTSGDSLGASGDDPAPDNSEPAVDREEPKNSDSGSPVPAGVLIAAPCTAAVAAAAFVIRKKKIV